MFVRAHKGVQGCAEQACCLLQVPYFNAPIFLQNKTQVGKIEEIFGSITVPVRALLSAHPPFAVFALRKKARYFCHGTHQ